MFINPLATNNEYSGHCVKRMLPGYIIHGPQSKIWIEVDHVTVTVNNFVREHVSVLYLVMAMEICFEFTMLIYHPDNG